VREHMHAALSGFEWRVCEAGWQRVA